MAKNPIFDNHPIFAIEGPLATITFNRPDKANAMHPDQNKLMRDFLFEVERKPEIRCVLLRGNGKHFMAGGDLETIVDFDKLTDAERARDGEVPIWDYVHMARILQRLKKPVVASVQGGVAGAAVGLIGACDFVIAADTSFYWAAHILHGGSNDGLVSYFLPRQIGLRKALEMCLLGERVYAPEAKEIGLINYVVPEAQLQEETKKLVDRLCKGPTLGYGLIKKLIYASLGNSLEEQGALEAELYGGSALHTSDVKDGLKAFFERRPPNFTGA
jgi:2-(1,2-epoxy-1,2-dihydrophenyl)acetyl-CoA isomerase